MNTWLIFGSLGVILVSILSIAIWKLKKQVDTRFFALGGVIWLGAFIFKLIVDSAVTPQLSSSATAYGSTGSLIIMGAYAGLRTGAVECGLTYLMFSKSDLRKMLPDEAVAFGIGFGSFEAFFLTVPSLVEFVTFIINPSLLNSLTPEQRQAIEAQLNLPTWIIPATIIERVFTLFVHVFASLLVFISVTRRKLGFFFGAFLFTGLLDALVPYFRATIDRNDPISVYASEALVVLLGITALAGIYWTRKKLILYRQQKLAKTKKF